VKHRIKRNGSHVLVIVFVVSILLIRCQLKTDKSNTKFRLRPKRRSNTKKIKHQEENYSGSHMLSPSTPRRKLHTLEHSKPHHHQMLIHILQILKHHLPPWIQICIQTIIATVLLLQKEKYVIRAIIRMPSLNLML